MRLTVIVLSAFFMAACLCAQVTTNDTSAVWEVSDITIPPAFPGGEAALLRFLSENIRYPKEAHQKKIQGVVAVTFVVDKGGHVGAGEIVKDIGGGCGAEVLRVLPLMPDWLPGEVDEAPVNVRFTLPVRFELDKDKHWDRPRQLDKVVDSKILSDKEIKKHHYQLLPAGMCATTFNPSGWNDNFLADVSDATYFSQVPDSLQGVPDQMPMFSEGLDGIYFYVFHYMKYPEEALRKKINGRVVMAIDIDVRGEVSGAKAIKAEYPFFAKAAEEALMDLPKFFPAVRNGEYVPIRLYIPIRFTINN